MASNASLHDAPNPPDAAVPLTARILHLPITTDAEAFGRVARASERVLVLLAEPGASQRQGLASFVLAGIEAELDRIGAAPRSWVPSDTLEEVVRDQLYRARLLGCFGVAVSFASVASLADAEGRLSAEDSETLRRLVALAEREPLQLHLPRPSAELMIAGAPEPLSAWLPPSREPGRVATIEYDATTDAELPRSSAAAKATLLPPLLEAFFDPPPLPDTPEASDVANEALTPVAPRPLSWVRGRTARAMQSPAAIPAAEPSLDAAGNAELAEVEADVALPIEAVDAVAAEADALREEDTALQVEDDELRAEVEALRAEVASVLQEAEALESAFEAAGIETADLETPAVEPVALAAGAPPGVAATASPMHALETSARPQAAPSETPAPPPVEKTDAERAATCLAWAAQLQGMSGPKAHGTVEKAFIGAYLPLCRELAAGGAPEAARAARDRWAEGFAQSYASAFRQLGGGARRPRMVRDVVELGSRWLGQHHARQCQLLLVSAMRFDLGQRLNEEIERRLTGKAVCVEHCVLWTALPSNAEAQQLGEARNAARRGRPEAPPSAPSAEIESGYVGSRELYRLRQLPDVLSSPGETETVRLGELARELADTLVPWIQRQPPETLIVIFGDHGFHWEADAEGTSPGQRGGALPEQVLVPASAWLLREARTRPKTAPGIH